MLANNYSNILVFKSLSIKPLQYLGYITFAPSAFFVTSSFISLKHIGKPKSVWEHTTKIIDKYIFRAVRHLLYLGSAIFSIEVL